MQLQPTNELAQSSPSVSANPLRAVGCCPLVDACRRMFSTVRSRARLDGIVRRMFTAWLLILLGLAYVTTGSQGNIWLLTTVPRIVHASLYMLAVVLVLHGLLSDAAATIRPVFGRRRLRVCGSLACVLGIVGGPVALVYAYYTNFTPVHLRCVSHPTLYCAWCAPSTVRGTHSLLCVVRTLVDGPHFASRGP